MKQIKPEWEIQFQPRDCWVGLYWKVERFHWLDPQYAYRTLTLYVCPLPMLPIRLRWYWSGTSFDTLSTGWRKWEAAEAVKERRTRLGQREAVR